MHSECVIVNRVHYSLLQGLLHQIQGGWLLGFQSLYFLFQLVHFFFVWFFQRSKHRIDVCLRKSFWLWRFLNHGCLLFLNFSCQQLNQVRNLLLALHCKLWTLALEPGVQFWNLLILGTDYTLHGLDALLLLGDDINDVTQFLLVFGNLGVCGG